MSRDGMAVCAEGAIAVAAGMYVSPGQSAVQLGSHPTANEAISHLSLIAKHYGFAGIIDMNDAPDMTKERILAVFDEAAGGTVEF
jgi:hypothetical protein